jgi:hypothetical protein
MRVISQNGKSDIPYEYFVFTIVGNGNSYSIIATKNIAEPPEVIMNSILATYSTEEKAIKAVEMLRTKCRKFQEITSENGRYFAFNYPKVFQFPQDSEV